MTTTVSPEPHPHHHTAFAAAGATAAVVVALGIGGIALSHAHGSRTQAPTDQPGISSTYSHHGASGKGSRDHFHYLGSGGRVQLGE